MTTRAFASLTIDPWDPGYGASIDIDESQEPGGTVTLDVEQAAWQPIVPAAGIVPDDLRCAFIDGVRRVDVRLFAEEDGRQAPAVAGSWAVGVAWYARPPRIDHVIVGRELIAGAGLQHPGFTARIGGAELHYQSGSIADSNVLAVQQAFQNCMRAAEGELARTLFAAGDADLLLLDGPLTYFAANGPVLGVIKRQSRAYLPPEQSRILPRLEPGARTPLFRLDDRGQGRYTWYLRIAHGRAIDGALTGILRVEVAADVGLEEAVRLANLTAALFPRFASQSWRDPRAPQNLYPVGQLEAQLRHRLGDPDLVRRAIESTLARALRAAAPSAAST